MGVLDDAIRDHLELKRRHGAPEAEIAEAEAEALGPARREPAGAAAEAVEPVAEAGGETELLDPADLPELHEVEPEAPATELHEVEPPAVELDDAPPELHEVEPEAPEAVPGLHEAAAELNEATPDLHEPVPEQPSPTPQDPSLGFRDPALAEEPPPEAPSEPEAVEPPAPSTRPHGDPALDDDMLEPDEVPDNERLWFEQKPKRDFDFDE